MSCFKVFFAFKLILKIAGLNAKRKKCKKHFDIFHIPPLIFSVSPCEYRFITQAVCIIYTENINACHYLVSFEKAACISFYFFLVYDEGILFGMSFLHISFQEHMMNRSVIKKWTMYTFLHCDTVPVYKE